ncbi:MAG: type II toxin-antitoxin system VapC family toxin [Acetobacteraceae bacterium]
MSFVIDNSIALAWCFEDEQTEAIMALLEQVTETGAMAPQLWPIEAINGLLIAERRGRISATDRSRLIGYLQALPIMVDGETASNAWLAITQLAANYRLTAYDATYLELALCAALPLATTDKSLTAAARRAGVAVLPPP